MGLFDWIFSRPHGPGVLLGDGNFDFPVVGTSFHQDALDRIGSAADPAATALRFSRANQIIPRSPSVLAASRSGTSFGNMRSILVTRFASPATSMPLVRRLSLVVGFAGPLIWVGLAFVLTRRFRSVSSRLINTAACKHEH